MVGILVSFQEGIFSGAMLVSGRVPPFKKKQSWLENPPAKPTAGTLRIARLKSGKPSSKKPP